MDKTIVTNSRKAEEKGRGPVEIETPDFLQAETLDALRELVEDDVILKKAQDSILVDLRAFVRNRMESVNSETGEFNYTEEQIVEEAGEWKPSVRKTLSKVEQAAKKFGTDPEKLRQALIAAGIDPDNPGKAMDDEE